MTPLERLRSDLALARPGAELEGSDRHSNPGRAARDLRRQSMSKFDTHRLEQAIATASHLDAQAVEWTADASGRLSFLFADGSSYPVAEGDGLDRQIDLIRGAESAHDARRALTIQALDPHASRPFKWLRDRLAGLSTSKFRSFLTQAGLWENGALTVLGQATGFFNEHEGEYGVYQTATAPGVAWIYAAHLAGKGSATNIDSPDFFGSTLLAFPVRIDWSNLLTPGSHETHPEMLALCRYSLQPQPEHHPLSQRIRRLR